MTPYALIPMILPAFVGAWMLYPGRDNVAHQIAASHPTAAESGVMVGSPPAPGARVTLENWQRPPFNRWAFLHTREVIPTANISRGSDDAWRLERGRSGLDSLELRIPGERMTIGEFLDHSWTAGMIVLHRGRVELEAYRNGMTPASRHIAMSVSKSITSLIIGILVDQKLIEPGLSVTHYVPELARTAFEGASIQHLLDMEVANAWREDYFGESSEYWRLDVACGWLPPRQGAAPTLFDFLKESRLSGRHGERFQYSSPNPDLLGIIAERVTGERFATIASRLLWQPGGMEFDADITLDAAGTAIADGGFCIALGDLARIGQLFLDRGQASGRQVVPERWIEECRQPHVKEVDPTSFGADWPNVSYHNQWWLLDNRSFALGIHGQMIAVDVNADLVVSFVSSAPEPNDREQRMTQFQIVGVLASAFT